MNILQQIFSDHYEEIKYSLKTRPVVMENIDRMIHCGDPAFGGAMYGCPSCGAHKFVPFHCKSRFCPSCGNLYSLQRSVSMSFKMINCPHRHCVFTIPQELRIFFRRDRSLLDCLFHAVQSVVLRMFYKLNKTEHLVPGFICVLHTFGRSLQWNPHVHVLITEGAIGKSLLWRRVVHFNYKFLRNAFRTALLKFLLSKLGPSFKTTCSQMYDKHTKGFYVYAKSGKCDPSIVTKYISRYLGRPVIATSRIDSYDGSSVTFHYNRHGDNRFIVETIPVLDFIKRLIIHIPDKHFKMIRYYGFYARPIPEAKFIPLVPVSQRPLRRACVRWRLACKLAFHTDPLSCPCCGHTLSLLYIKQKKTTLDDLYRKAMRFT